MPCPDPVARRPARCVGTLIALLLIGHAAIAAAAGVAPPASPAPLDLAAMTLVPPDIPQPPEQTDTAFAIAGGGQLPLPAYAAERARVLGLWRDRDVAALTDALAAAGWRAHYRRLLAAPGEEPSGRPAATVDSAVTEYADAAAAAAAFALLAAPARGAAGRPIRPLVPLGDEARITRAGVPALAPGPFAARFELTLRRGNIVAAVAIADLAGDRDWGVLALERLAAALLVRVDAGRAAALPGLAPRLLRLDDPALPPSLADGYDRRGGVTFPLAGVDPDDAADREGLYGAAIDVYTYERALPAARTGRGGEETAVPIYYGVTLYRFPDAAAATAWLEGAPERLLADPGSFLDLALVDAATLGDASRTLSYAFPVSEAVTARGHRVYARLGNEVARVQLDGDPEVPLAVVQAFVRAQLACFAAPACDAPPPVPLDALIPATPSGP